MDVCGALSIEAEEQKLFTEMLQNICLSPVGSQRLTRVGWFVVVRAPRSSFKLFQIATLIVGIPPGNSKEYDCHRCV
jgi:hypothetical protein